MKKVLAMVLSIAVLVCFCLFAMASGSSSRSSATTAAESTTAATTTTEATTTTTEATTTTTAAPDEDTTEETDEEVVESDDADGVDPELKKFLDSYEAYIDEYIDFMKKMNENPDDVMLIAEYGDMLVKYAEFSEAAQIYSDKYDNDEMSDADMKYYLEVMARIDKKLIDASLTLPST